MRKARTIWLWNHNNLEGKKPLVQSQFKINVKGLKHQGSIHSIWLHNKVIRALRLSIQTHGFILQIHTDHRGITTNKLSKIEANTRPKHVIHSGRPFHTKIHYSVSYQTKSMNSNKMFREIKIHETGSNPNTNIISNIEFTFFFSRCLLGNLEFMCYIYINNPFY